jgi:branched-chain amino acid aminotransferase
MTKFIFINNKIVPEEEARISIFDRSYLYGEGVFETLRAYSGHAAFSDLHYERLKKNCKRLRIDLPLNKEGFEKAINRTLQANGLKNAYIRVTVSPVGASYGMEKPKNLLINTTIFCKEFTGRPPRLYQSGAKVIIVKGAPSDHPVMADLKSTNYLNKMLARDEVIRAKADEGLFCSASGRVLEGSATNVFVVKNGELFTPPVAEGILPGITRSVVMNLAEGNGIRVHEESILFDDLKTCDEIFLTGSTTEILPVKELVDVARKSVSPGPVTKRVMEVYKNLLPS